MPLNKAKGRMFKLWRQSRIKTINPIHGCRFACYRGKCWASRMARRLQAAGVKGYENGFEPAFCPRFLNRRYKKGDIVFVGSMGDISFFSYEIHRRIIDELIRKSPEALFFLETKNPAIYHKLVPILPENVMLSTTIETNRDYHLSKAPRCLERFLAMKTLKWNKKHVSVEPIMDFDMDVLLNYMKQINPQIVSVGYDNYSCSLPEPSLEKTMQLIHGLQEFTMVELKILREAKWLGG